MRGVGRGHCACRSRGAGAGLLLLRALPRRWSRMPQRGAAWALMRDSVMVGFAKSSLLMVPATYCLIDQKHRVFLVFIFKEL